MFVKLIFALIAIVLFVNLCVPMIDSWHEEPEPIKAIPLQTATPSQFCNLAEDCFNSHDMLLWFNSTQYSEIAGLNIGYAFNNLESMQRVDLQLVLTIAHYRLINAMYTGSDYCVVAPYGNTLDYCGFYTD